MSRVSQTTAPTDTHLSKVAYPHFSVDIGAAMNDPFSLSEIQGGLQKLHNGRAKGSDGMPAEVLRYRTCVRASVRDAERKYKKGEPRPHHLLATQLTTLVNNAFNQGVVHGPLN